LKLGYEAKEEAFRRAAFNVMSRNCDDHTKNVSFILREGQAWELAPAYDVTHAYNPSGAWTYQHLMSVGGKFAAITRQDFLEAADRFGLGTAPTVLSEVRAAVAAWPTFAKRAKLSAAETRRIRGHHQLL
jgi:serine/threonine-protein kinase HipA